MCSQWARPGGLVKGNPVTLMCSRSAPVSGVGFLRAVIPDSESSCVGHQWDLHCLLCSVAIWWPCTGKQSNPAWGLALEPWPKGKGFRSVKLGGAVEGLLAQLYLSTPADSDMRMIPERMLSMDELIGKSRPCTLL